MNREACVRAALACIKADGFAEGDRPTIEFVQHWLDGEVSEEDVAVKFFVCADGASDVIFAMVRLLRDANVKRAWKRFIWTLHREVCS